MGGSSVKNEGFPLLDCSQGQSELCTQLLGNATPKEGQGILPTVKVMSLSYEGKEGSSNMMLRLHIEKLEKVSVADYEMATNTSHLCIWASLPSLLSRSLFPSF